MAEYIMKKLAVENNLLNKLQIDSAATSREEIGNDIYPPAKNCLKAHGIPFDRHSARQITPADLEYYDYIIAMEKFNIDNMIRMFGNSPKYSLLLDYTDRPGDISDPWYSLNFDKAYEEIEAGCRELIIFLKSMQ